ncbi:MAG: SUMF1/EgtB/PvdO family nonheme iron enzyme [Planctomycetota bacterium]
MTPNITTTRSHWQALQATWDRSDALFECVEPDRLYERPVQLRHPLAFYVGHLSAFASNMLFQGLLGYGAPDERLDHLFAFGIDPDETEGTPESLTLPGFDEICAYRQGVRSALLKNADAIDAVETDDIMSRDGRTAWMVLEHEVMHHETLLYLMHELPVEFKRPGLVSRAKPGPRLVQNERVLVPASALHLGVDLESTDDFVWDNELGPHSVGVPSFSIDTTPVTIQDYRVFIDSGGYRDRRWWTTEGWEWRERNAITRPKDWTDSNRGLKVRSMLETHPIDSVEGWPVCVSQVEAHAYAAWKGGRLPTENELRLIRNGGAPCHPGIDDISKSAALDFRVGSPMPVGCQPDTGHHLGVRELVGNGWEWTSTVFAPYPGFNNYIDSYPGYSKDFFDGKHYAVVGGSWATDLRLARPGLRNWFRATYPYPFTKFRVCYDA